MSPEMIEDTWRLLKARTQGKMEVSAAIHKIPYAVHAGKTHVASVVRKPDAELIAAAPTLLEKALKALEERDAEIAELRRFLATTEAALSSVRQK